MKNLIITAALVASTAMFAQSKPDKKGPNPDFPHPPHMVMDYKKFETLDLSAKQELKIKALLFDEMSQKFSNKNEFKPHDKGFKSDDKGGDFHGDRPKGEKPKGERPDFKAGDRKDSTAVDKNKRDFEPGKRPELTAEMKAKIDKENAAFDAKVKEILRAKQYEKYESLKQGKN